MTVRSQGDISRLALEIGPVGKAAKRCDCRLFVWRIFSTAPPFPPLGDGYCIAWGWGEPRQSRGSEVGEIALRLDGFWSTLPLLVRCLLCRKRVFVGKTSLGCLRIVGANCHHQRSPKITTKSSPPMCPIKLLSGKTTSFIKAPTNCITSSPIE